MEMVSQDVIDERTLELAQLKIAKGGTCYEKYPHFGTGGNFTDIFLWDTVFTCLWAKHFIDQLPVYNSLDNFYALQGEDGFISRQYLPDGRAKWSADHPISFAPPLFSWAELELLKVKPNLARLRKVYPHLKRHHEFIRSKYRREDGLYVCDALGCGMDDLPRWPRDWDGERGVVNPLKREHVHLMDEEVSPLTLKLIEHIWCKWNEQGRFIDTTAQVALDALSLQRIASELGLEEEAESWKQEHGELAEAINQHCWCEKAGFYFDLGFGERIERFHIGAYWTLIAEVVPEDRLGRFISHLKDPRLFGTETPLPALAACDPDFHPEGGYWNGGVWAPTSYATLKGLQAYGQDDLAKELAGGIFKSVTEVLGSTGTIWENYASSGAAPGKPSQPDFVGWSGLFTVAFPREFLD